MNRYTRVSPETDRLAAELRARMSIDQIAAEFDRRGIPTPGGPTIERWHASAVRRAILRATATG